MTYIYGIYDATITTYVVVDLSAGNIFRPLGWEPEIHSFCFRRVLADEGRKFDEARPVESDIEKTGEKGWRLLKKKRNLDRL